MCRKRLRPLIRTGLAGASFLFFMLAKEAAWGGAQQTSQSSQGDLTQISIENLMNIEVTSASKKPERREAAPAAIFVITGEEIRRGGFSSVPDALRMVPGLHVAQQNAHVWVVAARGFSSLFNNKMLVLVDGRLVYSPEFGGVWWDVQDPPLEDIERIEVIRGPGGTLWGANSVNGVINIVTKEAAKTHGEQVSSSAGINEGYSTRIRYGAEAGGHASYRIYGTSNYWLPTENASGGKNDDGWSLTQEGTRFDWSPSEKDALTFDGQGYSGREHDLTLSFSPISNTLIQQSNYVLKGGHVLVRWKHAFTEKSSTDLLGYCDWTARSDVFSGDDRNTCEVELQHGYAITSRQSLTWGGSILTTADTPGHDAVLQWNPASRRDTTFSVFGQYDVMVVPDKIRLILGSKFEHNDYTGFEYQPQFRAVWTPKRTHIVWIAVSRAVRTPTRLESDVKVPVTLLSQVPPTLLIIEGDPDNQAERLHAYEMGYRYEWKQKFALDAALYYNGYDGLIGTSAPGAPFVNVTPFYVGLPATFANLGGGQAHGLELSVKYTPVRRWTLTAGITELRGNSVPGLNPPAVFGDPRHQVNLQSRLDLTRYVNFDSGYYYYDVVPPASQPVNRIDLGISTKPYRGFSFSLWGRNLASERHLETAGYAFINGEIPRSVVFKLIWESKTDSGKDKH
jgi:iron complex outermembrane receptor protein